MATPSSTLRKKGNVEFSRSRRIGTETNENMTKTLRCLKQAISLYEEASNTEGASDNDQSSAFKNNAKSCMEIVRVLHIRKHKMGASVDHGEYTQEVIRYSIMALENNRLALRHGMNAQSRSWMRDMKETLKTLLGQVTAFLDSEKYDERIPVLSRCLEILVSSLIELSSHILDLNPAEDVLGLLREYNAPFEKLCDAPGVCDTKRLEERMRGTKQRAEAYKELSNGKHLFEQMIVDDDLNVDHMYVAIDSLNRAINRNDGIDTQLDAMAYSYLGQLYHKALHNVERALECLMKCRHLVDSLGLDKPLVLCWYEACTETLTLLERAAARMECPYAIQVARSEASEDPGAQAMPAADAVVTPAEARERYPDDLEFMDYIYRNFPPRHQKKPFKMPEAAEIQAMKSAGTLARFLPKLIFAYHPDKARGQDDHWKNICTEICAGFNGILSSLKRGL